MKDYPIKKILTLAQFCIDYTQNPKAEKLHNTQQEKVSSPELKKCLQAIEGLLSCREITTDLLTRTALEAASIKSDKIYYALLAEKFIAQYTFKMPHSIDDYLQTIQLLRHGIDTRNPYGCFYAARITEELPHSLVLTNLTAVELYQLAEK